jgi:hypothetical protein
MSNTGEQIENLIEQPVKAESDTASSAALADAQKAEKTKRSVAQRNFPASVFSEAFEFAKDVMRIGSGQRLRRLTLFDELKKSPTSGASRALVTNASKYGLTKGNYNAEYIELTDLARKCLSEASSPREAGSAQIDAAILGISPFKAVYEQLVENRLPANSVLGDMLKSSGVLAEHVEEATETFIVNLRDVKLLKTLSGQERVVSVEMALEGLVGQSVAGFNNPQPTYAAAAMTGQGGAAAESAPTSFENVAFYISPIGDDGSDTRKHADLFSSSIVEPALEPFGLNLVRADKIEAPGIITRQILEHIIHSKLVVVDMSFQNPNVFYELAIRHLLRKPIVQIIRTRDRIPFDVNQSRTIMIDDTSIYSFVPQLRVYVAALSAQVRQALDNPDSVDNPVSVYFPSLRATL